ncbi:branched-chain amino acid ABC transporter permease [Aromatoleum toluclasticum]|uniref:branched-chain amino acid ABC transporter permease n=1 Tax=Aromatoleum toluclasticum TaxID=92003 RepID=UPI001D193BF6|nr:branched-chain amino acid ABC transporter permease [Aromatoleum toluclasticum]MCC4113955.1 branched-chain amino acid ABC transporter permease [Aromatoleum toluclasticum]
MDYLINLVVSGVVVGSLYGLVAMGFAMIYRATGMVNFAHGEVIMLIAYSAFSLSQIPGLPTWVLLPMVVTLSMLIGAFLEWAFIRPMLGESLFSRVMVTIGLAVVIRSLVILFWGVEPMAFPQLFGAQVLDLGIVALYPGQVFSLAAMAILTTFVWAFFRYSRLGIAMRATSCSDSTALLMGVDVKRIGVLSWALSGGFAAFAGLSFCMMFSLQPEISHVGLRAFPASILGGLDSVLGGAVGGILIGIAENLAGGYLGHGLKEIAGFLLIIVVLMVKPYGLFGQREIERV